MSTPQIAEFSPLILQIEQDMMDQARLRTLLTAVDTTAAEHRQHGERSKLGSRGLRTVQF
jgi:hypothetical protein